MRGEVSVVVLTRNAGPGFGLLLERMAAQRGDFVVEVVVVDSGSDDGTVETARRFGALVHEIPPGSFDHGAARNLGVSLSRGEYVAFVVQDALPADGGWLSAMVEDLEGDPSVAGVYGRQLPRPEATPLTRVLARGSLASSERRRVQRAPRGLGALTPAERRLAAAFDDVSSCIRRSVWEEIPFEEGGFGEDLRWGRRVVEAGYALVYEPRSVVYHSHERGFRYDLRRRYTEARLLRELFGVEVSPPAALLSGVADLAHLLRGLWCEAGPLGTLRHAPRAASYAAANGLGTLLAASDGPRLERLIGGGL
ncbi:glycosyltransferase family 2 protein [Rubrobacter calidifluminis]|uniref:glycosyltransferase family 2 protein n=1 Tax=Rubrobacter calidifluminis TaxID=1392640 RepID=UPI00235DF0CF|nr:glycosyltransferase [Rubrobacter calidifluminis]